MTAETAQRGLRPGQILVYAGRYKADVEDLADNVAVRGEWEVNRYELADSLQAARLLVVLDPLSFPWETMTAYDWDTPVAMLLDIGLEAADLISVLGPAMLEKLGFFDYLITSDYSLWRELQSRYGWAERQLVSSVETSPGRLAAEVIQTLEENQPDQYFFGGDSYEARPYWSERGESLARTMPHRAICSLHHDRKSNKAMHRVQLGAIGRHFEKVLGGRSEDNPAYVLEIGAGIGRWAPVLGNYPLRFTGVDVSEAMVRAARANFPDASFEQLGEDLRLPFDDESFDLVFSVTVMHHNPEESKRVLMGEMFRVTRPGGKLLFLEDFVAGEHKGKSVVYPMGVTDFCSLVQDCSGRRVVLDHVEALRYPHDRMYRSGLLSLSKIGAPARW